MRARAELAWLACRMLAWSLAMPLLKRSMSLPALARLMWSPGHGPRDLARERQICKLAWWTSRVQPRRFPDNCLERSLVAYRFLARASAGPRLVAGVGKAEGKLVGHVWVTVDSEPVQDRADSLLRYRPLLEFGDSGRPTGSPDELSRLGGRAAGSLRLM